MASSKYLILGGGMVAGYAAKELVNRDLGSGELTIITAENAVPYERPPLSKGFLAGKENAEGIRINPEPWYAEHGIAIKLQTSVEQVDLKKKRLRARSGEEFDFETLLIATGSRARRLDSPGSDLPGVFHLRSLEDSRRIRDAAGSAKRAVVIGGGFIGMEVASVLAQKKIETTMVVREERVWSRVFTPEISAFFERYYAARGVQIVKNEAVSRIEGKDRASAAVLGSGRNVACDMVVAGLGATPVTELFKDSALAIENGIVVNEFLETSQAGVFAAGDVANYPDAIFGKRRHVEHWDNAVSQGQHWAAVVRGERKPFVHVPYFFSDIFDLSYELWGDSDGATQTITRGDMTSASFSVWWLKEDRVVSVFAMNRPDEERNAAPEWIQAKKKVSAERLNDGKRAVGDALI